MGAGMDAMPGPSLPRYNQSQTDLIFLLTLAFVLPGSTDSEARQPGRESWFCPFTPVGPQTSNFSVLISKMKTLTAPPSYDCDD